MTSVTDRIALLLVEDDIDIAAGIGDYLALRGIEVDFAYTASQARSRIQDARFDVLVLDVNLPDGDGFSLCREMKQTLGLGTPVIFLTAQDRLEDKLTGFAVGAVDYVVKPFAPVELLARVRAIASHIRATEGVRLRVGGYSLDLQRCLLSYGDLHLQLHAIGFTIMRLLMQAYPGSIAREQLCDRLWPDAVPDSDPLRAHIHQLRRALDERFGRQPIATVRGVGYRFEDDDNAGA
jgi:DNA-binding response OmpR family regulator